VNPDDATGLVMQIPESPPEQNDRRRQWQIELTDEGDARVDRTSVWSGQRAFEIRAELYRQGKEGWEKEAREEYLKLDPPGQIDSVAWREEENPDSNLQGTLRFVRRGFANLLPGGRLEVSPLTMVRHQNPFTREERNDPILFPYPYTDEDVFMIQPPPGYALAALPPLIERKSAVGRYTVRAEKGEGGSVVVSRQFELKRFWGGAELYSAYRSLFEWGAGGDTGFSLVFQKTASSSKKAGL
jgi:hypothetical protein